MIKTDPIIAVKDVDVSARWYQALFDCSRSYGHGGDKFETLTEANGLVLLCLHEWEVDQHPTMMDASITPGNGLILYFRTNNLQQIRDNVENWTRKLKRIFTPIQIPEKRNSRSEI